MLTHLPAPLTPEDCDLQDFKFMPLDVARLRDSDMASEQTPEENWAAVLLWSASWHQVPAGSIPDSENWIAKAAGYMMRGSIDKRWKDVRAGAMRGFVLCSDGRWYHTVVAEKANDSWLAKLRQRHKTECSRIKKHNERHQIKLPVPEFDDWLSSGCPVGHTLPVPNDITHLSQRQPPTVTNETHSKGQGEGQGQGQGLLTPQADDDSTDSSSEVSADPEPDLPPPGDDFAPPTSAPLPTREIPAIGQSPEIQLMVALRRQGVNVMSTNPHLLQWVADGVSLDKLSEAIMVARETKGPDATIQPGYLVPILAKILNPQAAVTPARPIVPTKPRPPKGTDPKGPDESYEAYDARIRKAELDRRKGQP